MQRVTPLSLCSYISTICWAISYSVSTNSGQEMGSLVIDDFLMISVEGHDRTKLLDPIGTVLEAMGHLGSEAFSLSFIIRNDKDCLNMFENCFEDY